MVRDTTDPRQAGSGLSKRNYDATSPAKTLAWIIACTALFCAWLVYTYGHTFGPDQIPGPSPVPQGVVYENDHSSVVRSVAQGSPDNSVPRPEDGGGVVR
jgi:hypothetical protein